MTQKAQALAAAHIAEPSSTWAIGAYGALAEFRRDRGEPLLAGDGGGLTLATARGAMRFDFAPAPEIVAYETLGARPGGWLQGVAFTLPAAEVGVASRTVLTELGADRSAILPDHRDAILFDLGLGTANVDACIRSGDAALLAELRRHAGRPLPAVGAAVDAIREAHPHRVFLSALGRIEVFAPIGSSRPGGSTPEGPHTHLLPRLLAAGRTHPATIDLGGRLPALWLYPAGTGHDLRGPARACDRRRHRAFQDLLMRHGRPAYVAAKRRTLSALAAATPPCAFDAPTTRLGRAALRIALRQEIAETGETALLASWRAAFDRTR